MAGWYIERGPESDVVISSRVRFARNFQGYPFPAKMNLEQSAKVVTEVKNSMLSEEISLANEITFVDINNLSNTDKQALVEKHLISQELAAMKTQRGALISADEKISIMVNEEDHLRIQCLFSGMQLESAWRLCNTIDNILEKKIDFAFNNEYGYLTCCPTNIGTGMRASVMLHLPALVMTGYIRQILEACGKLGMAIRGLYGENSEASGNMFQISNQVTLGQSEEDIVSNLNNVSGQIIEQERMLRGELYKQNAYRFEDKVMRSLGIFGNARIISSEESMKLISDVRVGIDMGIIKDIEIETLNELMLYIQPASLQKYAGRQLSPDERDIIRAEVVRKNLTKASS